MTTPFGRTERRRRMDRTSSAANPLCGRCPTGLLYGRIQSGKTLGMITTAALAMDNGFRIVVVLTSDNVTRAARKRERLCSEDTRRYDDADRTARLPSVGQIALA